MEIIVECSEGVEFLPDPYNCEKYYQCSDGQAYHMDCPPGTHWNASLDTCDWPYDANCTPQEPPQ